MACVQVVGDKMGEAYLRMKLKDQTAALELIQSDPALTSLRKVTYGGGARAERGGGRGASGACAQRGGGRYDAWLLPAPRVSAHHLCWCVRLPQVQAPLIDLEVRGVPALGYFGNVVWRDVFDAMNAGEGRVGRRSSWQPHTGKPYAAPADT